MYFWVIRKSGAEELTDRLAEEKGQGSVEFGLVVLAVAVVFVIVLFVLRPDFEGIINSIQQGLQTIGGSSK